MALQSDLWNRADIAKRYNTSPVQKQMLNPCAAALIEASGLPSDSRKDSYIFDNCCGTGLVTSLLFEGKIEAKVLGGDISRTSAASSVVLAHVDALITVEGMVDKYLAQAKENGWENVEAKVVDARDTKLPDNTFDCVISNCGVCLVGVPDVALKECFRILKPGGIVAWSSWNNPGWVDVVAKAMDDLKAPPFPRPENIMRDPKWMQADVCGSETEAAGFTDVSSSVIQYTTTTTAKEYAHWGDQMLVMLNTAWSQEEKDRVTPLFNAAFVKVIDEKVGAGQAYSFPVKPVIVMGRKPE